MKYLLSLVYFLLLSIVTYCQFPDAATIKKNKIRISISSGMGGSQYTLYDENGMGIKSAYEDETFKNPNWTCKIFYNEKMMPDSMHFAGNSKAKRYYRYAVDGSYTAIEIEGASSDTSIYTKDNKIKERRASDGGNTKYEYNVKRQLIKTSETNSEGKSVTTYIYNTAGLLQSKKTTGADTRSSVYTYDKNGLLIKEVRDYGSGSPMTTGYFYKFRE